MRCIAGALALMMAASLHAAPEDVLAPEYAGKRDGSGTTPMLKRPNPNRRRRRHYGNVWPA